jgi:gliding motility-associated lipoprotein GldD
LQVSVFFCNFARFFLFFDIKDFDPMRCLNKYYLLFLFVIALSACHRGGVPKPYGYFRIALPDTAYELYQPAGFPYAFRMSKHAQAQLREHEGERYWIDIHYPQLNATIHCSYKPVRNNLNTLSRDAQEFLYGHTTVASAIPVQEYAQPENSVYGLYYELYGNTATPIQFYLTDSLQHFFRGSVYCNTIPNQDSLAPIHEYLRQDARVIMESLYWR